MEIKSYWHFLRYFYQLCSKASGWNVIDSRSGKIMLLVKDEETLLPVFCFNFCCKNTLTPACRWIKQWLFSNFQKIPRKMSVMKCNGSVGSWFLPFLVSYKCKNYENKSGKLCKVFVGFLFSHDFVRAGRK